MTFTDDMLDDLSHMMSDWGKTVTVNGNSLEAMIDIGVEFYDEEGAISGFGDVVQVRSVDLPTHTHGTEMTVVETGRVYRLQRTIKDDGTLRTIQVTR